MDLYLTNLPPPTVKSRRSCNSGWSQARVSSKVVSHRFTQLQVMCSGGTVDNQLREACRVGNIPVVVYTSRGYSVLESDASIRMLACAKLQRLNKLERQRIGISRWFLKPVESYSSLYSQKRATMLFNQSRMYSKGCRLEKLKRRRLN
ncbi:hypothetical protein F511_40958 [Dorcoceras hygrometricum]|uniref:Uncharacterized protein n=1 Tax=Dorcoceras hygrometricum TaxID=472368 RepID=A0A2Z7BU71_9LAMI|nr:hypothetical protein F511_40958 [Dorcoceras hygrometricum]